MLESLLTSFNGSRLVGVVVPPVVDDTPGGVNRICAPVSGRIPRSRSRSRRTCSTDTWITSKVKTLLIGSKNINAIHVKVITENRTVYLMGLVTQEEADIATNVARDVDGVQRVVKLFEYIG